MLRWITLFFVTLGDTLGVMLACGLAVALCKRLFCRLLGGPLGFGVVLATSIIGTPIHELGHAMFCPLFAHRITDMKLWTPLAGGTLGHVTHTYDRRNPWAVFGNLFIGIGPIFSGLLVLIGILLLCFPATLHTSYSSLTSWVTTGGGPLVWLNIPLHTLTALLSELGHGARPLWLQIIGLLLIFSVCLHIHVSLADVIGILRSMPICLTLCLLAVVIVGILTLCGIPAAAPYRDALRTCGMTQFALFSLVLTFSLLLVALALVIRLLRILLGLIFGF